MRQRHFQKHRYHTPISVQITHLLSRLDYDSALIFQETGIPFLLIQLGNLHVLTHAC